MHRRPSILTHRPKTSAADDRETAPRFDAGMKRTASQTFLPSIHDSRDASAPLTAVMEGASVVDYAPSHHVHSSSLSRASQVVGGGFKHICRRLSASSNRRPPLAPFNDLPLAPSRKSMAEFPHQRLQHQDSGVPPMFHDGEVTGVHSKFSSLKGRFGSIRRRPATSGPSGESARYNPAPVPIPANYPTPMPPGHAARAAAAANNERMNERIQQKREQDLTARFLAGHLMPDGNVDDVIKDSESGVGMETTCPALSRTDSAQEKRLDPIKRLPAELTIMILSNLDAATLIKTERLSHAWRDAASSPHVWRSVFLRRFAPEVHVSPAPIMMGGAGIGKFVKGKPLPGQDWKKMYETRLTINRRWKNNRPSAIYLNGHTDSVYCCQFDETKIITGSRDRTIRVWDMKTYSCIKVIGGPANIPVAGTPAPLETHPEMVISYPSVNGTKDGADLYSQPSDYHEASILCLQYDDRIMVTGSSDHTCIVWDITDNKYEPMYRLRNHTAGVLDVCLDDKHIISCSKDASINVWDRATGNHIRTLTGHRGPVNAVQLRGHLLVSASGDGVAKLWNLESGACIKEFPSQDRGLAAVEFSDDAKYVLAGGNDHVVYKFDAMSGQLLNTSERHGGLVRSLFLDAHNGRIVSGSYDQSIRIADYHDGGHIGTFENWTTSWILSAKSDYRRVVATSQDGRALILDFGWRVEGAEGLVDRIELGQEGGSAHFLDEVVA